MCGRALKRLVALILASSLVACAALTLACRKARDPGATDSKASQGYWKSGAPGKSGAPAPPPGMEPGMKAKAGP